MTRLCRASRRVALGVVAAAAAGLLAVEIYFAADIYAFEYRPILALMGVRGLALLSVLSVGAAAAGWRAVRALAAGVRWWPRTVTARASIVAWSLLGFWACDWVFLTQHPLTFRLSSLAMLREPRVQADEGPIDVPPDVAADPARRAAFLLLLDRVAVNRPAEYAPRRIVETVTRYSQRYGTDPVLLYYWLYLCSFYGEAPAGRVPFLRAMTSETIRDFVQIHLPTWFVESPFRSRIIADERLDRVSFLGHTGHDWRYAFQKATYDVSVEPYDTNTYTDVFLVMREYRAEFEDVLGAGASATPVDRALRDAFVTLEPTFMRPPYDAYGDARPWTPDEYARSRAALRQFTRAAFYKMVLDLDFSTRVQALVARYYAERYAASLGARTWDSLEMGRRDALLAILRDVYTPNIGHPSGNVYNLPELNLAPFAYVASEAARNEAALRGPAIWTPPEPRRLWGAATTKLRVLSEVWQIFHGQPLPGVRPTRTFGDARTIVAAEANP